MVGGAVVGGAVVGGSVDGGPVTVGVTETVGAAVGFGFGLAVGVWVDVRWLAGSNDSGSLPFIAVRM